MAQAYPISQFVGFDYHGPPIGWARRAAARAGVTNAKFEVATAKDFHALSTISSHFSIACMTWETLWARLAMAVNAQA